MIPSGQEIRSTAPRPGAPRWLVNKNARAVASTNQGACMPAGYLIAESIGPGSHLEGFDLTLPWRYRRPSRC
jgi:hypothetical protein